MLKYFAPFLISVFLLSCEYDVTMIDDFPDRIPMMQVSDVVKPKPVTEADVMVYIYINNIIENKLQKEVTDPGIVSYVIDRYVAAGSGLDANYYNEISRAVHASNRLTKFMRMIEIDLVYMGSD
jgi:hypothetical protein